MTRQSPPVHEGDEHTLEIADLAFGGQGVARVSGFVVFVDDALPDELVRVRIRRVRQGYAEAECLEIVTPSTQRVVPPCRYFGECGGCDLQHLDRSGQAESKRRQVAALLERVAGISDPPVREVEAAGDPLQYRFRIDFDWGATRDGRSGLGLHRSGHPADIVPVETCLLVPEVANRIRAFLERRAAEKGLTPRDPRRRRGLMRRAGIQMARTTREILITLETERGDPPALLELAHDTARAFPRVVGIVRREYDRHDREIGASILHGRDHLFEDVEGDRMKIPAGAFFQPNATAWNVLRGTVLSELQPGPEETILELYCGAGFFTLPVARRCRQVVAIDVSRETVAAARDNAARAGIGNVRWLCRDALEGLSELLEGTRFDAILIDPPRTGLPRAATGLLARSAARRIVYVSCDPATLARDLRILTEEGSCRLRSVVPLDLFPQTHHVECVARLGRPEGGTGGDS
jgi:23S rRNA (uracil1939-C5)-methyltransferase